MRINVVGAGIVGSSVATLAREAGHDVTVIAHPDYQPASYAALCVLKAEWQKGPERAAVDFTLEYYRQRGMITTSTIQQTSYRRKDRTIQTRDGYYAVAAEAPLVPPDVYGEWPYVGGDADITVLARGAYSDAPGVRAYGVTSLYPNDKPHHLSGHEDRPRNTMFAVSHDLNVLRFGSSVAKDLTEAYKRQQRDEQKAVEAGLVPDIEPKRIDGVRLMPESKDQPLPLRKIAANMYSIEGAGRVGYSLAPARAALLLSVIS